MAKSLYSLGKWKIIKKHDIYCVYEGAKKIDESKDFAEAYDLLQLHKKSLK